MRRLVIDLGGRCNNRCVHCGIEGARDGARDLGARSVVVQTNARRLAYASYARTLAAAGVTELDVALYGATAATHDYHTRTAGAFAQTCAGIKHARAARLKVGVTALVTRSSWRELPETVALAARLGAERVHVSMTRARGAAEAEFDRVVPRLGMVGERVAEAVRVARAARLLVATSGFPACVLGEAADAGTSSGGAFGPACDACAARPTCGGVDPAYAARVSLTELIPLAERPVARPDLAAAARAARPTFVGLARAAEARPAPERAARADIGLVQLRTLGATAPGRNELRAPARRKTGDELKTLFPGLYGGAITFDGGKAGGDPGGK